MGVFRFSFVFFNTKLCHVIKQISKITRQKISHTYYNVCLMFKPWRGYDGIQVKEIWLLGFLMILKVWLRKRRSYIIKILL